LNHITQVHVETQVGSCDEMWGTHFLNIFFSISHTSFCCMLSSG